MSLIETFKQIHHHYSSTEGTRWAVMKRYDIPDVDDPTAVYLRRWRIVQTPLFALYLHKINLADGDRDLHDHPFPFAALILKGGYDEEYVELARNPSMRGRDGTVPARFVYSIPRIGWSGRKIVPILKRTHRPGHLNIMRTTAAHRIRVLHNGGPAWTLVFVGPRVREWGFWTTEGFIPHPEYFERFKIKS